MLLVALLLERSLMAIVVKEGKRLAKVLKHEGKVERKALEVAMKELAELQAMQKQAIKVSYLGRLYCYMF